MKLLKLIAISAALLASISSFANQKLNNCSHVAYGQPSVEDYNFCRIGYAIGYDKTLKSAVWVAYKLERDLKGGVERQDDFREDTDIEYQYRTTVEDYSEPVYDMGHLANSESVDTSIKANSETFLMSNMVPQLPGHNRSIWKGLENRERKWANNRGHVVVYTGPIYDKEPKYIGNKVPVPASLWKIIYSPTTDDVIAFLIPHQKLKTSQLNQFIVSVDDIEALTNLDFLNKLNPNNEKSLEAIKHKSQWKK